MRERWEETDRGRERERERERERRIQTDMKERDKKIERPSKCKRCRYRQTETHKEQRI